MAVVKPTPVAPKHAVAKPVAAPPKAATAPKKAFDAEVRRRMIAEAAYYIAEKRGFIHGHHDADWAQAERQIDSLLARGG